MKLPLDDPSWNKFAERHRRFMARHPNFEAHAEEQARIFLGAHARGADDNEETTDNSGSGKDWAYVTKRYRISNTSAAYSVQTPFGIISVVTNWKRSASFPQAKAIMIFSWDCSIVQPYELLLCLISPNTLLSLTEPISLGTVTRNGGRELSPEVLSDPDQPVAFRLILADAVQRQVSNAGQHAQRRFSSSERAKIVRQYREIPKEFSRPLVAHRLRQQEVQSVLLREPRTAGGGDHFPPEQALPPEWFGGYIVTLKFHSNRALCTWSVSRQGPVGEFMLQLWGEDEPLGQPVLVGDSQVPLPQVDFEKLVFIEIFSMEDNHER